MTIDDIRDTLTNRMATHRIDLERLVGIPSVSAPGFDPAAVRRSAEEVAELLSARGLESVALLEVDGAHPAVYGDWLHAGDDAPTVLCYAHHDVQPPGDEAQWKSPPFEATERDGRLFGRGAADDKAGILVHVAAIDAWLTARGTLPVNVKVLVEGEEETGSEHLAAFLDAHGSRLAADVVVLTDSVNWKVGVPALTYQQRGLVDARFEVRAAAHALHSGMYGGVVPDPVGAVAQVLASLTGPGGEVAIPGFADDARPPTEDERSRLEALDFDEGGFREEAGLLADVPLAGDPGRHPLERIWMAPSVTVIGVDAPTVAGSSNTIQPRAGARVSVRLAPGQDPVRARDLLCSHIERSVPWGLESTVTPGAAARPYVADPAHPSTAAALRALSDAYGRPAVLTGIGGTIPFIEPFVAAFSRDGDPLPALLTGVEDPDTRAHGTNESLHLDDWHRACLGQAYLLAELARAREVER